MNSIQLQCKLSSIQFNINTDQLNSSCVQFNSFIVCSIQLTFSSIEFNWFHHLFNSTLVQFNVITNRCISIPINSIYISPIQFIPNQIQSISIQYQYSSISFNINNNTIQFKFDSVQFIINTYTPNFIQYQYKSLWVQHQIQSNSIRFLTNQLHSIQFRFNSFQFDIKFN